MNLFSRSVVSPLTESNQRTRNIIKAEQANMAAVTTAYSKATDTMSKVMCHRWSPYHR